MSSCKQFLACQLLVLSQFDLLVTAPLFSRYAYNDFSNQHFSFGSTSYSQMLQSLACMVDSMLESSNMFALHGPARYCHVA